MKKIELIILAILVCSGCQSPHQPMGNSFSGNNANKNLPVKDQAQARETHGGDPCIQQTSAFGQKIYEFLINHPFLSEKYKINTGFLKRALLKTPLTREEEAPREPVIYADCNVSFIYSDVLESLTGLFHQYLEILKYQDSDFSISKPIIEEMISSMPQYNLQFQPPSGVFHLDVWTNQMVVDEFKEKAREISCEEIKQEVSDLDCDRWELVLRSANVVAINERLFLSGRPVAALNKSFNGIKEITVSVPAWTEDRFYYALLAVHEYLNLVALDYNFEVTNKLFFR